MFLDELRAELVLKLKPNPLYRKNFRNSKSTSNFDLTFMLHYKQPLHKI